MLLGRGTLASLSCHCNTITHLQLSWTPGMSSVPSLGDLPPTNGERRDVPPDLALAGRPPSRPAPNPPQDTREGCTSRPVPWLPNMTKGGPRPEVCVPLDQGSGCACLPAWHQRRRTSANTVASGAREGYLGPGSGKTLGV